MRPDAVAAPARDVGAGARYGTQQPPGNHRPRPLLVACLALIGLLGCDDGETPLARGDRLWADSAYTAALAEYRLSYARSGSVDALARVAHAYAVTGQFAPAHEAYRELLARAPEYVDQAVFDYLDLARRAEERSDRYAMAGAVEAALALRPGLPVERMTAALARYYATTGAADRAAEYFEAALGDAVPDSVPGLLYELAQVQQARGRCGEAIPLYEEFLARAEVRDARLERARYALGSCCWQEAQQASGSDADRALSLLAAVTRLGVPGNIQDDAWFEQGEILAAQGRDEEALAAYMRVLELSPARRSELAERARRRIDALRFGRGPATHEPGGGPPGNHSRP